MAQTNATRVKIEKTQPESHTPIKQELQQSRHKSVGNTQTVNDMDQSGSQLPDAREEDNGRSRKRVRANTNGAVYAVHDKGRPEAITRIRDEDGYLPGSILRIQLRNFVTYENVEFRCGPYLNMILGPNGTGKSTIACAICLGLNGHPKLLGRADSLNAFVRAGARDGHIEIELKGLKGDRNIVIRRTLNSTSRSSTYTLNGRSVPASTIDEKMRQLGIQMDNLCSFLPQDKVSEFAQMSPQQLLKETQRAAGDSSLTDWHKTLIASGKDFSELRMKITEDESRLTTLRQRNEALERDVHAYNQRKAIETEISLLEVLLAVQEYRESLERYKVLKGQQRELFKLQETLQKKNEPARKFLRSLERKEKELDAIHIEKKKIAVNKTRQIHSKKTDAEKMDEDAEKVSTNLSNLRKNEKNRVRKIKELEADAVKYRRELEKTPASVLDPNVEEEQRVIKQERRQLENEQEELQVRQRKNVEDISKAEAIIRQNTDNLRQLDDVHVQKLQNFARWNKDHADAVMWLRANKGRFEAEVFEPPALSVTVTDPRYANAIESCFSSNQLQTFVVQTSNDRKLLNRVFNDTPEALGRKIRINNWYRAPVDIGQPPFSPEEMRELGFDGYALDFIQCPEGLKHFLQLELQLHRTAIASSNRIDVDRAMRIISNAGGGNFIAGTTMNAVRRSAYGRKAAHNATREIREARNLGSTQVNQEEKQQYLRAIEQARGDIHNLEEEKQEMKKDQDEVKAKFQELTRRNDSLQKRRKAVQEAAAKLKKLELAITNAEKKLEDLRNAQPIHTQETQLKKQLLRINKDRVRLMRDIKTLYQGVHSAQIQNTLSELQVMQVTANKNELKHICELQDRKYQEAAAEFSRVDKQYRDAKTQSKEKLDQSRDVLDNCGPEIREKYDELDKARVEWEQAAGENNTPPPQIEFRNAEHLRIDLDAKHQELEMHMQTNPGVVEQFKRREKEIEELDRAIVEKKARAEGLEKSIKNARDKWQPALQELVKSIGHKFSNAFERLGCAGEVRVSEHDDYDKWAIDILVKFRDTEKLQLLTGQRQSGGERSLTTILYLMSLTEQSRAPFSLVDEINQGMDARAERAVHNSMVNVTCQEDSSQYFLITPKLLTNLEYHERMRVLCVNNGEWLPDDPSSVGNLGGLIDNFISHRDRARNAN